MVSQDLPYGLAVRMVWQVYEAVDLPLIEWVGSPRKWGSEFICRTRCRCRHWQLHDPTCFVVDEIVDS